MPKTILFPEYSAKNTVISILKNEWPLPAKLIFERTKTSSDLSYQAIYKALSELAEEGILVKDSRKYLINIDWVSKLEDFSRDVKHRYLKEEQTLDYDLSYFEKNNDVFTFLFDDLMQAEKYRKNLQIQYFSREGKKKPYCGQYKYFKTPLVLSEKGLETMRAGIETNTVRYILSRSNSEIDKWCTDFYFPSYAYVKLGVDCAENCETMVLGDVVFQLYMPEELDNEISNFYEGVSTISDINIPDFDKKIFRKKSKIKVVIFKNPEVAEQIRKQTIGFFDDKLLLVNIDYFIDGLPGFEFMRFLIKKGIIDRSKVGVIGRNKLNKKEGGRKKYEELFERIMSLYVKIASGKKKSVLLNALKEFSKSYSLSFPNYIVSFLEYLSKAGKLVIITAYPTEFFQEIYKGPKADIIGSELGCKKGVYTGELKTNLVYFEGRRKRVCNYLIENNVALNNSYAFGTTLQDLSFLMHAGNPIAFAPNTELKEYAKKNNWKIFEKSDNFLVKAKENIL